MTAGHSTLQDDLVGGGGSQRWEHPDRILEYLIE